jgi:nitrate reductase gamma subunit
MTIFLLGSAMRYDRDQYTWKSDSSQLLRKKGMLVGSNLFHIGIILLFFGHFVGLLTPEWVYHPFMSAGTKQIMAMIAGGIFGTMCLIGILILLNRRLFDKRISKTSTNAMNLISKYIDLYRNALHYPKEILSLQYRENNRKKTDLKKP